MAEWWYVDRERKVGPINSSEVSELIRDGKIGAKTMLWKEGMDSWSHLDEIDELLPVKKSTPPPIPTSTEEAKRFPRFFARIFDVWWETMLVGFFLGSVLSTYSASFAKWILFSPYAEQIFGVLCLPIALVMDAAIYKIFGNTPGKALLGIQIRHSNGERLELDQYLGRNFSMWWYGLAAGVPFINLITMSNQGDRLNKGEPASYDEPCGYMVTARPVGLAAKSGFGVAFLCLFVIIAGANNVSSIGKSNLEPALSDNGYSWANPATGLSTRIDSSWKATTQKNEEGQPVYTFTDQNNKVAVMMALEEFTDDPITLSDYVAAFRFGMKDKVTFDGSGKFYSGQYGEPSWDGQGAVTGSDNGRVSIKIARIGNRFWRVVTVSFAPYNKQTEQIENSIWKTVI